MLYLVEIDYNGLFPKSKYHQSVFKLVYADSIEEAKELSVKEYEHCLDVIYFPVAVYETGNKVCNKVWEKE